MDATGGGEQGKLHFCVRGRKPQARVFEEDTGDVRFPVGLYMPSQGKPIHRAIILSIVFILRRRRSEADRKAKGKSIMTFLLFFPPKHESR